MSSIREQIASLEELSIIDSDLRRLDEELGKQQDGLGAMRAEVSHLEDRVRLDRETLTQMEKTRSELNIELRQMSQQIERSREKLLRSRNEREQNAAQREMEELRKLHRDREEELQRLSTAVEEARGAIETAEAKRAEITKAIEGSEEGTAQTVAVLQRDRTARLDARKTVVEKLPVVLYRRYESIRTRRPVAIAKTHDGTCLGCHMSIPPMMFQKMRRMEELERCPNCHRILYYVPPPEAGAQDGGRSEGPGPDRRA